MEAELFACALGNVYTFGPTFRAENSNTPRHAAEFWMIEPEMAFADLQDDMDLGEDLVRSLVKHALAECAADLELFARFVDTDLMANLRTIAEESYVRMPYREAITVLQRSGKSFEFPVAYGVDLQTEHERYLTEEHCKKPVMVHDYPKEIKSFYMRLNDDGETVAAMDLLVPRIGELIGGMSARGAPGGARTAPRRVWPAARGLLVVSRHPTFRHGAARRFRTGLRAFPDDGHRRHEYP